MKLGPFSLHGSTLVLNMSLTSAAESDTGFHSMRPVPQKPKAIRSFFQMNRSEISVTFHPTCSPPECLHHLV